MIQEKEETELIKTVLIGCNTIRPEIEYALKTRGKDIECRWLNSGLHDVPNNLRTELQKAIDQAAEDGYERILLGFAFCGGGLSGIHSRSCELILPRVDDCITFFLGSPTKRRNVPMGGGTYYLTWGWAFDREHLWHSYDQYVEDYGEEMADELMEDMMGNYKQVGVINTHCYELDEIYKLGQEFADKFHLERVVEIDSDNSYAEKLLTGPWEDHQFLVIPPEHKIIDSMLTMVYE